MPTPQGEACTRCKRHLQNESISDERDFRQWARRNHPDKGGDVQNFQRTSQCVDMVFKERCVEDGPGLWGRRGGGGGGGGGDGTPPSPGSNDDIMLGLLNILAASSMKGVGFDAFPTHFARGKLQEPTAGVRLSHRRIGGIPIRLYSELELRFRTNQRAVKLVSAGALWSVPFTRGAVKLGLSAADETPEADEIRLSAWEATGRLELGPLRLEGGWGGKDLPWEGPRSRWDQGKVWGVGVRVLDLQLGDIFGLPVGVSELKVLGVPLFRAKPAEAAGEGGGDGADEGGEGGAGAGGAPAGAAATGQAGGS